MPAPLESSSAGGSRPSRTSLPMRRRWATAKMVAAVSAAAYHGRFHPFSAPAYAAHLIVPMKLAHATARTTISATNGA